MASRSSGGSGLVVTVAILGVACLALFILTIVFLSKYQAASRTLAQMNDDTNEIVRANERQSDEVTSLRSVASKKQQSVVKYLNSSLRTAMKGATGTETDTVETLGSAMEKEGVTVSLLSSLRDAKSTIAALNSKVDQADKARNTAIQDRENEVERSKKLTESHNKTVQAMNSDIDKYKAEVEAYRLSVDDAKKFMDKEIEKKQEALASMQGSLNEQVRTLQNENLSLKDQLAKLRSSQSVNLLHPKAEQSLVDGEIISINQASNTITVSRGRDAKVILGMTFAVYPDATAIRPDPRTGDYPRPKATLEVTNVGDTTSTCRITGEVKGNPIVRGDVIANAVYDPAKVYTFLVFGNFDADGDGIATPREQDDIKAMIVAWGGKNVDDLTTGNVDFLVLGDRPMLPAPPGVNDPAEIVQQYMRLAEIVAKYDRLFEQATSTSIPVLNQNRLNTLIGRRAGSK